MNALHIHIGEEYAVAPYGKPNGNALVLGAKRFKVMRIFGEKTNGNKRDTMFVEGFDLDKEQGVPIHTSYRKYRCRDVIEDWEEHWDRLQQYEVEQARRAREREQRRIEDEARWAAQRAERERLAQEREQREQEEREKRQQDWQLIKYKLGVRGFNTEFITADYHSLTIPLSEVKRWLGMED